MLRPIEFHRPFPKHYQQRIAKQAKLRQQYAERLKLFAAGKRDNPLNDHPLTGPLAGKRAWWVTGDIRVVYVETDEAIIFVDIGSHFLLPANPVCGRQSDGQARSSQGALGAADRLAV